MPHKRIKKAVSSFLSAPARTAAKRRGGKADKARKAIKFLRGTKGVPANPKTSLGRKKLSAQQTVENAKRRLKRR